MSMRLIAFLFILAQLAFLNAAPIGSDSLIELSSVNSKAFVPLPEDFNINAEVPVNYPEELQNVYPTCLRATPSATGITLSYNPLCQYCGVFPLAIFNSFQPDEYIQMPVSISCQADLLITTVDSTRELDISVRNFMEGQAIRGVTSRFVKLGQDAPSNKTLFNPGSFYKPNEINSDYERSIRESVALTDARSLLILSDEIPRKEIKLGKTLSVETDDDYGLKTIVNSRRKLVQENIPVARISGTQSEIADVLSTITFATDQADVVPLEIEYAAPSLFLEVDENGQQIELQDLQFPVKLDPVEVSSTFGPRIHPITLEFQNHNALDLSTPEGTEVYAPLDGTAFALTPDDKCGNGLTLTSGDFKFGFCHLKKIQKTGQVKRGDLIALSGNTGGSTGPHLHFTTRFKGQLVDPLVLYLGGTQAIKITEEGKITQGEVAQTAESHRAADELLYGKKIVDCAAQNDIDPALLWQLAINKLASNGKFDCASENLIPLLKGATKTRIKQATELIKVTGTAVNLYGKYLAQPLYRLKENRQSNSSLYIFKTNDFAQLQALTKTALQSHGHTIVAHSPVVYTPAVVPFSLVESTSISSGELLIASKQQVTRDNTLPVNLRRLQARGISLNGDPFYQVKVG